MGIYIDNPVACHGVDGGITYMLCMTPRRWDRRNIYGTLTAVEGTLICGTLVTRGGGNLVLRVEGLLRRLQGQAFLMEVWSRV